MTDLRTRLAERAEQDRRLYEQYGEPLEKDHTGEYVAIAADTRTVLGTSAAEVLREAVSAFGRWLAVHGCGAFSWGRRR